MQFLGHVIDKDEIFADPANVEAVINWEQPNATMKVRSFLGLTGYYWQFIQDFSKIATLLINLIRN